MRNKNQGFPFRNEFPWCIEKYVEILWLKTFQPIMWKLEITKYNKVFTEI